MARSVEYLEADGETDAGVSYDWGTVAPDTTDATKRWIRNNGTLALVNLTLSLTDPLINGGVGIFQHALDTATVRPPYAGAAVVAASASTGGHVLVAAAVWYFRVSRVNATGETQGSAQFSYTVADITKGVILSWSIPSGPTDTGLRVYASQTSGTYSGNIRIGPTLSAGATTYTWNGAAPTAGTFPVANTTASVTGPDYGTAPALVTTDLTIGALGVGEARAFWKGYDAPSSTADETYIVNTHPAEV